MHLRVELHVISQEKRGFGACMHCCQGQAACCACAETSRWCSNTAASATIIAAGTEVCRSARATRHRCGPGSSDVIHAATDDVAIDQIASTSPGRRDNCSANKVCRATPPASFLAVLLLAQLTRAHWRGQHTAKRTKRLLTQCRSHPQRCAKYEHEKQQIWLDQIHHSADVARPCRPQRRSLNLPVTLSADSCLPQRRLDRVMLRN